MLSYFHEKTLRSYFFQKRRLLLSGRNHGYQIGNQIKLLKLEPSKMYIMHMIWSTIIVTQNYGKSSQLLLQAFPHREEERLTLHQNTASNKFLDMLVHFAASTPTLLSPPPLLFVVLRLRLPILQSKVFTFVISLLSPQQRPWTSGIWFTHSVQTK